MYSTTTSTTSAYNALSDVVVANQCLTSIGRQVAIDLLLAVIRAHSLEEVVGLRLLHKHNEIQPHEIMLEDAYIDQEGFSLITSATIAPLSLSNISPNSWILCDDGFVPFEFSQDALLQDSAVCPATYPLFFQELAVAIRVAGLARLIGPALISSEFVHSHRPADADIMLELSAIDDRANVLRFAIANELSIGSPIETFWAAGCADRPANSTPTEPEKAKTERVCTRICPSVQNPPVHQGTYIHNQS